MDLGENKSVLVKKFGGYESISVENVKLPPLDDFIEVEVEYGGLNFADIYTRQGLMRSKELPFILGIECCGTISAIGVNVKDTELKVGQRVVCYDYNGGMYRQKVRVLPSKCYRLPDYMDSKTAAAVFVNYLTAWFSVMELGHLKKQEKVLILSCTGGVGTAATQIAKMVEGVKVFGTGSETKSRFAVENGIDQFYTNEKFTDEAKGETFDLIITNQMGKMFSLLQDLLNPLGRIVIIGANNLIQNEKKLSVFSLMGAWWANMSISPERLVTNNRIVAGLHLGTLSEKDPAKVRKILDEIFAYIHDGKLCPKIHSVFTIDDVVQATRVLAERKNTGKVLLCMRDTKKM